MLFIQTCSKDAKDYSKKGTLAFDYLGKYNAGSIVITIPGNNGLDLDTVGVSCTSIPR